MEWENKTQMIKLHNNITDSLSRKEFVNYVVENVDYFDDQDWDMFITAVELDDSIYENYDSHKCICEKSKKQKTDNFRTAIRLALYEELIFNRKKFE
jgi:hypothetical protein